MHLTKRVGITAIIFSALFLASCGDTFRPIATPEPQPGGDPERSARAIAFTNNGTTARGAAMVLNVSGDTHQGVVTLGRDVQQGAVLTALSRAYAANPADDNVTGFPITSPGSPSTTGSLPPGSQPVFVGGTGTLLYVAEAGTNKVAVMDGTTLQLIREIDVGTTPVALVQTPSRAKLYVVNQGSNDVTIIQTVDNTVLNPGLAVGTSPVHAVASADNTLVFVANEGSHSVSVIDAVEDTVIAEISLDAGAAGAPRYLFYDRSLRRLYTANPTTDSISIIRADQPVTTPPTPPVLMATLSTVTDPECGRSGPASVTALADGTRAYVATGEVTTPAPPATPFSYVCVLLTTSNDFTRRVQVGSGSAFVASSNDSSKVYSANPGGGTPTDVGSVSIIRTVDDTVVATHRAPKTDPNCVDPAAPAPPVCTYQSPVWVAMFP